MKCCPSNSGRLDGHLSVSFSNYYNTRASRYNHNNVVKCSGSGGGDGGGGGGGGALGIISLFDILFVYRERERWVLEEEKKKRQKLDVVTRVGRRRRQGD